MSTPEPTNPISSSLIVHASIADDQEALAAMFETARWQAELKVPAPIDWQTERTTLLDDTRLIVEVIGRTAAWSRDGGQNWWPPTALDEHLKEL